MHSQQTIEKAILVSVRLDKSDIPFEESLEELKELARTAGASPINVLTQARKSPDPKYYIGPGKLEELKEMSAIAGADLIIFDHPISASQTRNLEEELGIKVIDRTELILDIFAQHAHTREGALQVKLAQAEFMMSRLTGSGSMLSRQGGGIGTRGPGESKLESDRRRTRRAVADLRKELESIKQKRQILREKRKSSQIKTVALVGYTNSGKSTLLNALSGAKVLTENQLFSTLDPVTRRVYLPSNKIILVSDTVGFIQNLPHQLVDAFRATIEETVEADLLLVVVDASSHYIDDQINAVRQVLSELKIEDKPQIVVFNKIDKPFDEEKLAKYEPYVKISALRGTGIDELFKILAQQL